MSELADKARNEYGITNADDMSDKQLKAEMAAIDGQPKTDDAYVAPKKEAKVAAKPAAKPATARRRGLLGRRAK